MPRQIEPCPRCGSDWVNEGSHNGPHPVDCGCATTLSFAFVFFLATGFMNWLLGGAGIWITVVIFAALGVMMFAAYVLQLMQYNLQCAVCGLQWSVYPWQLPKA
jgi:hypothetical protein